MTATTVVDIHDASTTITAVVGIVVAGIFGPLIAVAATRWHDRRQFDHERRLKSSDDLIARIDEVAEALEGLGEACATMRQAFLSLGVTDLDVLLPLQRAAEDAFQRARALIARLGMRPHADHEMVEKAKEAAKTLDQATHRVRGATIRRRAASAVAGADIEAASAMGPVVEAIEAGYERTREFEALARVAIGKLVGSGAER